MIVSTKLNKKIRSGDWKEVERNKIKKDLIGGVWKGDSRAEQAEQIWTARYKGQEIDNINKTRENKWDWSWIGNMKRRMQWQVGPHRHELILTPTKCFQCITVHTLHDQARLSDLFLSIALVDKVGLQHIEDT